MRRPTSHAVLILIAIVLALSAKSIFAERLPIKIYTSADGLGSSFVNGIMRDSRGFLWICTRDGLSRFDGAHFVTYQVGDKNAPPGIESILETRQGIYWIVTTGGLYRFDPRVLPAAAESTDRPRLNAEFITETRFILTEDRNGDLWGGLPSGLYHAVENGTKTSFEKVNLKSNRDLAVTSIVESRDGSLWIGSYTTVLRRTPDGGEIYYDIPPSPHDAVTGLQEDRDGRIWVGRVSGIYAIQPESLEDVSAGRVAGARSLDSLAKTQPAIQATVTVPQKAGDIFRYAFFKDDRHAKCFYETSDGKLWLSDGSVVANFDGRKFEVLNSGSIKGATKVAQDSGGNLWLAGSTGLMRVDRHGLVSYGEDDGLKSTAVTTIGESQNGHLYFSGDNFSLTSFDGNSFRSIRAPVSQTAGMLWAATGVYRDSAGEWWIPTTEGLFHFAAIDDPAKLDMAHPLDVFTSHNGLKGTQAFHVFEDSKGALWVSARDTDPRLWGLSKWDRATRTFYTFGEADGFPANRVVSAFAEDRSGTLWLGMFDGGVLRYAGGRFADVATDLPASLITAVHVDHSGRVWIASSQAGLKIITNPAAAQLNFTNYSIANGLASNNVRSLAEDAFGNLYVGTARGVDRVSADLAQVVHYSIANGLAGDFITAAFCDSHNNLWFGTPSGLSRLTPETRSDETAAPILLSGLRIAGEPRPIPEIGSTSISDLELTHSQNNLQIDFFAIDFAAGEEPRYQYRLEGADHDWSQPTAQRTVNFSNLAPGSYRFLVRAINSAGIPSITPAVVSFKILPPFWRRWWFIGLAVLIVAATVLALDRYRVARLRALDALNRRLKLEYEITRVLAESGSNVEAAPGLLQAICETLAWDVGVIWDVDQQNNLLRCVAVWHKAEMAAAEFEAQTATRTFMTGEGLPGRVWATATPLWIRDLKQDENFPRSPAATHEGLRSGFSFPILVGTDVVGVIEFFNHRITDRDQGVEEMMQPIGREIGQLLLRKQSEQALRESETRFRTLAETASDAIITIDTNSIIIYINRAAENIFGYQIAEMMGQDLTMLMPEYLRHVHRAGLDRYLETGKRHIGWSAVELPGLHKDGHEIPLELSFGEFTRNEQRYFTGIARDATERKRAEEELRRTREARAIELERVRKRIASDLHDDIGSSLTQISLLSEVVNQRVAGHDGSVAQPLAMIASSSRELVDAMSDIVWAINPQKDHLSDLTQRMRTLTSEVSTACGISVRFNAPESDEDLPLGANLRREVFLIFKESINNIVKHSNATAAEVEFRVAGDQLFLRVADNGKGFDVADESEGHGLVSMQGRAKEMGAKLEMQSSVGKGTTISLVVPLS
jgi:PAS domain S-box-containing protein